jgi:hypothetical protein
VAIRRGVDCADLVGGRQRDIQGLAISRQNHAIGARLAGNGVDQVAGWREDLDVGALSTLADEQVAVRVDHARLLFDMHGRGQRIERVDDLMRACDRRGNGSGWSDDRGAEGSACDNGSSAGDSHVGLQIRGQVENSVGPKPRHRSPNR